jgi:hypothetical protein
LGEKSAYRPRWVAISVPKQYVVTIRKKNERVLTGLATDEVSVIGGLSFACQSIASAPFRFNKSERATIAPDQNIVNKLVVG